MDNGLIIYYYGQDCLRINNMLYTFSSENEARKMNESMRRFREEGTWPGTYIEVTSLQNNTNTLSVPDYEIARTNWKGSKKTSLEQGFLMAAIGGIIFFCAVAAVLNYLQAI